MVNVVNVFLAAFTVFCTGVLVFMASPFGGVSVLHGTSMNPTYTPGDILVYESIDNPRIELDFGDVAAYRGENVTVSHRVVGFNGSTVLFSGDNSPRIEHVPPTRVESRVVFAVDFPRVLTWVT